MKIVIFLSPKKEIIYEEIEESDVFDLGLLPILWIAAAIGLIIYIGHIYHYFQVLKSSGIFYQILN